MSEKYEKCDKCGHERLVVYCDECGKHIPYVVERSSTELGLLTVCVADNPATDIRVCSVVCLLQYLGISDVGFHFVGSNNLEIIP